MIKKTGSTEHKEFLDELKNLEAFFTDSHAHIHFSPLSDDAVGVLKRADEHKVKRILTIGTDIEDSIKAVEFAGQHKNVYAAVGVHPHDVKDFTEQGMVTLKVLLKKPKVLALGEVGLDFYYDNSPRDMQESTFANFLRLATEESVPVIIHNRDSTERMVAVLGSELPKRENNGIIHCFSGDTDLLRFALDHGFYISYAGVVTYPKSEELRATLKYVPRDRLLIETDSPFLSPLPYRGKTNEPAYTAYTALTVATELKISLEELAEILESNFLTLFGDKL
jgi:TatD DNase family protein